MTGHRLQNTHVIMDRKKLQHLIQSLESLKRVTDEAVNAFDEAPLDAVEGGWWILDPEER